MHIIYTSLTIIRARPVDATSGNCPILSSSSPRPFRPLCLASRPPVFAPSAGPKVQLTPCYDNSVFCDYLPVVASYPCTNRQTREIGAGAEICVSGGLQYRCEGSATLCRVAKPLCEVPHFCSTHFAMSSGSSKFSISQACLPSQRQKLAEGKPGLSWFSLA